VKRNITQSGFTLIEIAIVLLVVAILLGYSVAMLPVQQELKQYRHANTEMDSIIEHLIAFAQVNGRLPCPDTSTNTDGVANSIDGEEDPHANATVGCEAFFGFLPARTLGMNGKYDAAGVLIDPWGSRYRYAVSNADRDGVNGDGRPDLVIGNGIRDEGLAAVNPDLQICSDSDTAGMDTACADVSGTAVVENVAVVIVSLGKDYAVTPVSAIQQENSDDFHNGTNDKVYIFSPRRDDYDDVVKWIPRSLLFSRMLAADQLP
jgi:prepilin-type N-terminal cleavage/methylation domain-containing protein